MLSPHFLETDYALLLGGIARSACACNDTLDVTPILLPFFEFPGAHFYERKLRNITASDRPRKNDLAPLFADLAKTGARLSTALKTLFKIIGISFDTHKSDSSMTSQAHDISVRVMRGSQVSGNTVMDRASTCSSEPISQNIPSTQFSMNDRVRVLKESRLTGELATVLDADWNASGMVASDLELVTSSEQVLSVEEIEYGNKDVQSQGADSDVEPPAPPSKETGSEQASLCARDEEADNIESQKNQDGENDGEECFQSKHLVDL